MTKARVWLVELRGDKTQEEVAKESGIGRSGLANIEAGKRNPKIKTAKNIAKTLNFDWTKFFEEEDEEQNTRVYA